MTHDHDESRRPVTSRNTKWAPRIAFWLKSVGFKPNTISVISTIFALAGAAGFFCSACPGDALTRALWLLLGVIGILGRLLCNLFDGLVAVEGGLKTATGEIFNDLPDRISDLVLMVASGYAAAMQVGNTDAWHQAGWCAAALSILTAYIRYLGAAQKVGHFFLGPMAKQQRMAVLILSAILSVALEPHLLKVGTCFRAGLVIIIVGSIITCVRRVRKIAAALNKAG